MSDVSNCYLLDRPARIAFSGGRTSGYMLYHVLQAFGGVLPDDVLVTFANTGKEREETLQFVHECQKRWNVSVRWIEYCRTQAPVVTKSGKIGCHGFKEVDFHTASRNGEPFEQIIDVKAEYRRLYKEEPPILPNVPQRYCTAELKQRSMKRFMKALGFDEYTVAIGIRHDEHSRIAKLKALNDSTEEYVAPLNSAKVTEEDVMNFWASQPFDLQLQSYEGNCDFCFLKSKAKIFRLAEERPEGLEWWSRMEQKTGQTFRRDRPTYTDLKNKKVELPLFAAAVACNDDQDTCFCTD